jgi:signal transduction histidine kinase
LIPLYPNNNRVLKDIGTIIEMTALHQAGNEFPVELAIVSIKQDRNEFYCVFIRDISLRKKAEEVLRVMELEILNQKVQEQKKITRAIIKAQEMERNRIGQELHDNVNQLLASTKMFLGSTGKKFESIKEFLKYPMELIDDSIAEIRALTSRHVTPLKNVDLQDLVKTLLDNLKENSKTEVIFVYHLPNGLIDDELKLNIYRILQEQINNILKHAAAKNVSVAIEAEDKIINIWVVDDGKGFDPDKKRKGIGISNMFNRVESFNGEVKIETSPGNGCKTRIKIPY